MASKSSNQKETVKKDYPSDYGSHKSMIVEGKTLKAEVLESVALNDVYGNALPFDRIVALKDKDGVYVTDKSILDNGMADPNRYGNSKARIKESLLADVPKPVTTEVLATAEVAEAVVAVPALSA